jgi:hypothetical protein
MKELINKSELLLIIKESENSDISRMTTSNELISILENGDTTRSKKCPLFSIKERMENYIQDNIRKMRTQLPNCTGHCTTYGCPNGIVVNCYINIKDLLGEK